VNLFTQLCVTLASASVVTAVFVRISLQSFDPEDEAGHQGGNLAVASGSIMAGLLYTPVLAYFVWGLSWWLAILVTPSAFITGMFGFILALPLLNLIEWMSPSPTE